MTKVSMIWANPHELRGVLAKLPGIGITGLLTTGLYLILFYLAVTPLGSTLGHVVAYLMAIIFQFSVLSFRVFRIPGGRQIHAARGVRYLVQVAVVFVLSVAVEMAIVAPKEIEGLLLIVFITFVNALFYFAWTFRS